MISEIEIRKKILAVASGQLSLADLEDWIDDVSWNMHRDSEPDAVELASSVLALFSARDAGFLSEKDLRVRLNEMSSRVVLSIPPDVVLVGFDEVSAAEKIVSLSPSDPTLVIVGTPQLIRGTSNLDSVPAYFVVGNEQNEGAHPTVRATSSSAARLSMSRVAAVV